jgi:hypothetical protein
MAARTKKLIHDHEARAKIQSSQLVNRLQKHVLGASVLDPSQVSAALGLLRKIIPDLAAIEHSGEVKQTYIVSPELPTTEEWEAEFGAKHLDS